MKCPTEQDLSAFIDGELSSTHVADVAEHVETCATCSAQVAEYRMVGQTLREAVLPVPSLAAQARWLKAASLSSDRSVRRLAGWMTAAASIVLMVTLFMSFSQTAQATPMLADWEATAIAGPESDNDASNATAQLIELDLAQASQNAGVR